MQQHIFVCIYVHDYYSVINDYINIYKSTSSLNAIYVTQ